MSSIIREIVNTPFVVIENDPEIGFPDLPRFRRTHTIFCIYCQNKWGDIHYDRMSRVRVCYKCRTTIENSVSKKRQNLQYMIKMIQHKNRVLEDIIEVGMNPDRVYQTLLVETLYLFKQPSI